MASHKSLVFRIKRHRPADEVPIVIPASFVHPRGDATRNGVGSTGSDEMGGGLAYFKTIRLCSITAALSNTIAVAVNRISRSVPPSAQCGVEPP
jgi:hypothetical protein